ncbi:hypothetical protein QF026_002891 [Streptomyces aurantiacus]|uniref:hypothetical protein n=1 Tax=Streptomyces aurantiacus TaxID=47760 RepID=UPI0027945C76|nr:hypothetical protein [Streptomyces aurantiacus]MDQ0774425.1 hypothetical protein [Streptomyces aurantiacus]
MSEFVREGRLFRVVSFAPSHRQLILRSDATLIDGTDTRVEVYFGHVELMFLRPIYREGLRVRRASDAESVALRERHGLAADDASAAWMIELRGDSFVVSGAPAWREAVRRFEDPPLFDFSQPWPPDFPVQSGLVD